MNTSFNPVKLGRDAFENKPLPSNGAATICGNCCFSPMLTGLLLFFYCLAPPPKWAGQWAAWQNQRHNGKERVARSSKQENGAG